MVSIYETAFRRASRRLLDALRSSEETRTDNKSNVKTIDQLKADFKSTFDAYNNFTRDSIAVRISLDGATESTAPTKAEIIAAAEEAVVQQLGPEATLTLVVTKLVVSDDQTDVVFRAGPETRRALRNVMDGDQFITHFQNELPGTTVTDIEAESKLNVTLMHDQTVKLLFIDLVKDLFTDSAISDYNNERGRLHSIRSQLTSAGDFGYTCKIRDGVPDEYTTRIEEWCDAKQSLKNTDFGKFLALEKAVKKATTVEKLDTVWDDAGSGIAYFIPAWFTSTEYAPNCLGSTGYLHEAYSGDWTEHACTLFGEILTAIRTDPAVTSVTDYFTEASENILNMA